MRHWVVNKEWYGGSPAQWWVAQGGGKTKYYVPRATTARLHTYTDNVMAQIYFANVVVFAGEEQVNQMKEPVHDTHELWADVIEKYPYMAQFDPDDDPEKSGFPFVEVKGYWVFHKIDDPDLEEGLDKLEGKIILPDVFENVKYVLHQLPWYECNAKAVMFYEAPDGTKFLSLNEAIDILGCEITVDFNVTTEPGKFKLSGFPMEDIAITFWFTCRPTPDEWILEDGMLVKKNPVEDKLKELLFPNEPDVNGFGVFQYWTIEDAWSYRTFYEGSFSRETHLIASCSSKAVDPRLQTRNEKFEKAILELVDHVIAKQEEVGVITESRSIGGDMWSYISTATESLICNSWPQIVSFLKMANAARKEEGAYPLHLNPKLCEAAIRQAEDMAKNKFLGHTGSDGSTWISRINDADYFDDSTPNGICISYGGWENCGVITGKAMNAKEAFEGTKASPPHWATLINPEIHETGIAFVKNYFCQTFGQHSLHTIIS